MWYSQLPSWVTAGNFNASTLASIITTHCSTVVGHYKGQMYVFLLSLFDGVNNTCFLFKMYVIVELNSFDQYSDNFLSLRLLGRCEWYVCTSVHYAESVSDFYLFFFRALQRRWYAEQCREKLRLILGFMWINRHLAHGCLLQHARDLVCDDCSPGCEVGRFKCQALH